MEKREEYKTIELSGRKWRIGRFDALTGSYITFKILTQVLPMGLDEALPNLPKSRSPMTKEDFTSLQEDCLKVCYELKDVNGVDAPVPVMLTNGNWGVSGLEKDILTVIGLTAHTILFNVQSFFAEGALDELTKSFKGLTLPNLTI
jgi:hypothetical protein